MIIDLILDRKEGTYTKITEGIITPKYRYKPKIFYNNLMRYYQTFPEIVEPIVQAMDEGDEHEVKKELSRYIIDGDYNLDIIKFINSVNWLK